MMLLDTHIWLRWLSGPEIPLPKKVLDTVQTGGLLAVSAVSVWEAAYLVRAGRVDLGMLWEEWLPLATTRAHVEVIPLSEAIAVRAAFLPLFHRDPADRFIMSTALEHNMQLLSLDAKFPLYQELIGHLLVANFKTKT